MEKGTVIILARDYYEVRELFNGVITCNRLAIKHKFYEGMIVVDSNLVGNTVTGLKILRPAPGFGWIDRFINPVYEVELELEAPGVPMTIEQVQSRLVEITSDGDLWEEWWGDLDDLHARIRNCQSFQEIVELLGSDPVDLILGNQPKQTQPLDRSTRRES